MNFGADAFCSGGIGWFHWPSGCVPQALGLVGWWAYTGCCWLGSELKVTLRFSWAARFVPA